MGGLEPMFCRHCYSGKCLDFVHLRLSSVVVSSASSQQPGDQGTKGWIMVTFSFARVGVSAWFYNTNVEWRRWSKPLKIDCISQCRPVLLCRHVRKGCLTIEIKMLFRKYFHWWLMESFKDLSMAQRTCSNDTTYRFVDKHPNFRWRQLSAKFQVLYNIVKHRLHVCHYDHYRALCPPHAWTWPRATQTQPPLIWKLLLTILAPSAPC